MVRWRLETKNDESRFGLTRAPLVRLGRLERGQSHRLSPRRAKRITCSARVVTNFVVFEYPRLGETNEFITTRLFSEIGTVLVFRSRRSALRLGASAVR